MRFFTIVLLLFLSSSAFSQNTWSARKTNQSETEKSVLQRYTDSLTVCREMIDSLMLENARLKNYSLYGTEHDPRYMRLFTPMTYHPDLVQNRFAIDGDNASLADDRWLVDDALMDVYLRRPWHVKRYGGVQPSADIDEKTAERKVDTFPLLTAVETPQAEEQAFEDVDIVVKKPNFWSYSGEFYLQAMQNYYSDNWYQGYESNYSWLARVTLQANYNNKQKVTWDNKLEMNIGFKTDKSDEVHKVKTSEDLIRYTGKVGLQATKKWYYTFQLIANTQFTRSYESNSDVILSDFLSPLNVNASIGMQYNFSWLKDKFTGSIYLSPCAVNYKYVDRLSLAADNGIDEGKHSLADFGSTFTIEGTWNICNNIKLGTRLYGYTAYDRTELQWENTINMTVNKFIAMTIYVYPRFDDSSISYKDDSLGYFQIKEYTSFGLTYSF